MGSFDQTPIVLQSMAESFVNGGQNYVEGTWSPCPFIGEKSVDDSSIVCGAETADTAECLSTNFTTLHFWEK